MMRLLYLSADPGIPVLGHKGASVHVRELCAAFAQAGVEVHLASPRVAPEGDLLTAPAALHAISPVLPKAHAERTLRAAVRAQARAVTQLCARFGIDAIYERFALFSAAGVRAAAELGLPHVLEVNSPLREESSRFRTLPHPALAAFFEAEVLAGTDQVLAVSEPLARALVREGVESRKIDVVPNGVAANRFLPPRRDADRFRVGFAGSMKPWHGVEILVEAVSRVPDVHLEVVGNGPLTHLVERLPSERVTSFGALRHADVIERMAAWDVGVAPYMPIDGFWFSPLKLLEYMAAGACAVASDLGDAAELLGHGSRGVLVPAGDAGVLAGALAALAADRPRAWSLGEQARKWAAANRSWSANVQRALRALRRPRTREVAA